MAAGQQPRQTIEFQDCQCLSTPITRNARLIQ
jgi:hypothetical protein